MKQRILSDWCGLVTYQCMRGTSSYKYIFFNYLFQYCRVLGSNLTFLARQIEFWMSLILFHQLKQLFEGGNNVFFKFDIGTLPFRGRLL